MPELNDNVKPAKRGRTTRSRSTSRRKRGAAVGATLNNPPIGVQALSAGGTVSLDMIRGFAAGVEYAGHQLGAWIGTNFGG